MKGCPRSSCYVSYISYSEGKKRRKLGMARCRGKPAYLFSKRKAELNDGADSEQLGRKIYADDLLSEGEGASVTALPTTDGDDSKYFFGSLPIPRPQPHSRRQGLSLRCLGENIIEEFNDAGGMLSRNAVKELVREIDTSQGIDMEELVDEVQQSRHDCPFASHIVALSALYSELSAEKTKIISQETTKETRGSAGQSGTRKSVYKLFNLAKVSRLESRKVRLAEGMEVVDLVRITSLMGDYGPPSRRAAQSYLSNLIKAVVPCNMRHLYTHAQQRAKMQPLPDMVRFSIQEVFYAAFGIYFNDGLWEMPECLSSASSEEVIEYTTQLRCFFQSRLENIFNYARQEYNKKHQNDATAERPSSLF